MTTQADPIHVPAETQVVLILGCGAAKRDHACTAGEMYLGSMWQTFRKNRPANVALLVMSAKFGLIDAETVIEPYEATMTAEQSQALVNDAEARARVESLWNGVFGTEDEPRMIEGYMVAGEAYVATLERMLPPYTTFEIFPGDLLEKRSQFKAWLLSAAARQAAA